MSLKVPKVEPIEHEDLEALKNKVNEFLERFSTSKGRYIGGDKRAVKGEIERRELVNVYIVPSDGKYLATVLFFVYICEYTEE